MSQNNGSSTSLRLKTGLAEMLKGGVIMDVTTKEQAIIAELKATTSGVLLIRIPEKRPSAAAMKIPAKPP